MLRYTHMSHSCCISRIVALMFHYIVRASLLHIALHLIVDLFVLLLIGSEIGAHCSYQPDNWYVSSRRHPLSTIAPTHQSRINRFDCWNICFWLLSELYVAFLKLIMSLFVSIIASSRPASQPLFETQRMSLRRCLLAIFVDQEHVFCT